VKPMTALGVGIVGCGTISGIYLQNISRFPGLRKSVVHVGSVDSLLTCLPP